ncbi:MAG TPA: hypothetical protein VFJ06_09905 [Halococcus sp.]|nr:hypothetical protein [Halococcus sp.]
MDSNSLTQTILEAERIGLILFFVLSIAGSAVVSFGALSANDHVTALMAGASVVSGIVVLCIIVYMETHIWDSA